jgi:hypothetical protein
MWSRENVVLYPLLCTAAGFGSGCFGIGGGTITGPLMLALDMHPQVVAATASFMILFTSSLTTTQFLIVGALNLEYGAWCALTSNLLHIASVTSPQTFLHIPPVTSPQTPLHCIAHRVAHVAQRFCFLGVCAGVIGQWCYTRHPHARKTDQVLGVSLGRSSDGGSSPSSYW